jgi:hypothetical protein
VVVSQSTNDPSSKHSAIKAYRREVDYFREVDVYHRLHQKKITQIRGCQVPQLLGHDENWLVIEMTLVTRPFVLDFAGAYLDRAPDFSEEVMADWRADKEEQFGKRWPECRQSWRCSRRTAST